jgi:hypothetical protein
MSLTSLRARRSDEGAIVVAGALVLGLVFIVFVGFVVLMFLAMSSAAGANGNKNSTPSARAVADIPQSCCRFTRRRPRTPATCHGGCWPPSARWRPTTVDPSSPA